MAHVPTSSELPISLQGQLLLASPALADGIFDHSVIILAEHSLEGGALGAIINLRSDHTIGDILPNPEFKSLSNLPVHHGGPVSTNELSFSSFSWIKNSGLNYQTRIPAEKAMSLIGNKNHLLRATIGHSAWSPGQLENELMQNSWIPVKPTQHLLSVPHDATLWSFLMKAISPYHNLLSQAPKNPFLN